MRYFIFAILSTQALAGGLEMDKTDQQLRAVGAYGLAYTASHMYREMGASKLLTAVLTGATVLGAGYLLDGRGSNNRMAAYGVGAIGGSFTFNLFDGDEAPKGYKPPKMEQKNSQHVNVNVNIPDSREYIVTPDNRVKVQARGKVYSYTSPLFRSE